VKASLIKAIEVVRIADLITSISLEAVRFTLSPSPLSLPPEIIVRLGLPWTISNPVTLSDGSEVLFDFYTGTVIWDGQYCNINLAESPSHSSLILNVARL
jgi:hypothetical protein